ncbi:methylcobamide--CoM methyltransferase [Clostridiaceae bacterium UIB06]|nr:methylcobamide--CoM methyltransferase [Clostridiaceae bacterium UIB06]
MEKNTQFKCQGDNLEEIPECIIKGTGLSFPKAHTNKEDMTLLAKEIRKYRKDSISRVPFCITVEAEALGADVNLGDMEIGPRVGKYVFNDIKELENIGKIDLSCGRIKEVLDSVEMLKNQGETVALSVEGPFTIISSLIDPMMFYKGIRNNKEAIEKILKAIEDNIVNYILEGIKRGAKIISYGDPVGALDIVGPKVYKDYSGKSTYNILKKVEPYLENVIIHLCGKTSTAFESIGLSKSQAIIFHEDISYGEAINKILKERKNINFIGNSCIKRTPLKINNSMVWEILIK